MKLREITRTEAFFTGVLHHATEKDAHNLQELLKGKLEGLDADSQLIDSGCEVCFFRDFFLSNPAKYPRQNSSFEKQTFDNVFIFSDRTIVLIEAKANQKFKPKQIKQMVTAADKIVNGKFPFDKVFLVGLCSSRYRPKDSTIEDFHAVITWNEISECFSSESDIFRRADLIYNDR